MTSKTWRADTDIALIAHTNARMCAFRTILGPCAKMCE